MVLISGIPEMLGGLGVLIPRIRRAAALGLVALLVAVFSANIYMAAHPIAAGAAALPAGAALGTSSAPAPPYLVGLAVHHFHQRPRQFRH